MPMEVSMGTGGCFFKVGVPGSIVHILTLQGLEIWMESWTKHSELQYHLKGINETLGTLGTTSLECPQGIDWGWLDVWPR